MNNKKIIAFCKEQKPSIIYLAIGPAHSASQQYPPFLNKIEGKQLCLLFDPRMEEPLSVYTDPESPLIIEHDNIQIIPIKRDFYWEEKRDRSFVHDLCELALSETNTRLIVQDYTGRDIRSDYPIQTFGPALLRRVLFDFTYKDGGCFVDFNTVTLYLYPDGSFIQPQFDRISAILPYVAKEKVAAILQERNNRLIFNAMRYYRVLSGTEEAPEWCSSEYVEDAIQNLWSIYGINHTAGLSKENLEQLLLEYLLDIMSVKPATGSGIRDDAITLVRESGMNKTYSILGSGYEKLVQELKRGFAEVQ